MDHVDSFSVSLGALVAFTLALLVLTVVLLVLFRSGMSFLQRFQSIGAERVNGRVQVRGLFEETHEPERQVESVVTHSLIPEFERASKARAASDEPS
jgi:hypothetical protein